jgi:AcrR family transcriptional regulator
VGNSAVGQTDGRTARRDRNRDAVLDSMISLIEGGNSFPTVADISAESDVSHRSVYRYFDDLNELFSKAVVRAYVRYSKFSIIHGFGKGSFENRVEAIVEQRLGLFESLAPLARAARRRAHAADTMEAALAHYMAPMRDQVQGHFAEELAGLSPGERDGRVTTLELVLSFDGHEFLSRKGWSGDQIRQVYRDSLRALLRP